MLPLLLPLLIVLANDKRIMGRYANSPLFNLFSGAVLVFPSRSSPWLSLRRFSFPGYSAATSRRLASSRVGGFGVRAEENKPDLAQRRSIPVVSDDFVEHDLGTFRQRKASDPGANRREGNRPQAALSGDFEAAARRAAQALGAGPAPHRMLAACMTKRAVRLPPLVMAALPTSMRGRPTGTPPGSEARLPARLLQPPPPPNSRSSFAAFTMASTSCCVRSPWRTSTVSPSVLQVKPSAEPARPSTPSAPRPRCG